ncbi:MAG: hypothetical protein JXR23_11300 [Pontiellaceae bacterium]|nr:hypothetical protein [Pontiellaceae bacterium]
MTDEQKTDLQLIAHEISRIPGSVGVPVQDVQKALDQLTKQTQQLASTLEQSGQQVADETTKLTDAINQHALSSTKLAKSMLRANIFLVIATFALVAVAIIQFTSKNPEPQQHNGQILSEGAPSAPPTESSP